MRKIILLFVVQVLILSACASGPSIVSNTSPGTDLGKFRTFNFHEPLGTDRASGAQTPLSIQLKAAMEKELKSRGLSKSDSPDLLVDFSTFSIDSMDVLSTPSHSLRHSNWNRSFTTWPTYQTTVSQYTEGSLIIDFLDPKSNQLVAEGAATSRLSSNNVSPQQVKEVVGWIMTSTWAN